MMCAVLEADFSHEEINDEKESTELKDFFVDAESRDPMTREGEKKKKCAINAYI